MSKQIALMDIKEGVATAGAASARHSPSYPPLLALRLPLSQVEISVRAYDVAGGQESARHINNGFLVVQVLGGDGQPLALRPSRADMTGDDPESRPRHEAAASREAVRALRRQMGSLQVHTSAILPSYYLHCGQRAVALLLRHVRGCGSRGLPCRRAP